MINNDISNHLSRYFNRPAQNDAGGLAQEMYNKIKAKRDSMQGRTDKTAEEAAAKTEDNADKLVKDNATVGRFGNGYIKNRTKTEDKKTDADAQKNKNAQDAEANLTPEEKRQKELQKILDKINAEEAERHPNRTDKKDASKTEEKTATTVVSPEDAAAAEGKEGFMSFLNDMPLFNEFKTGLMDAFKRLDSATAGSISAQYELNYTSMQYIADAAGNYEYKETSLNIKLDLNYVKAAGGGKTGKEIADLINSSEDFESLVNNLKSVGMNQGQQTAPASKPEDIMSSLQDYFSPEKTAGRILDFSTAFFPNSDAFKKYGDTEEGREEFAKMMRDAIQKGFDQAMGKLGSVPKKTQEGIDKTHELVFKGIDDFVKNGMDRQKQESGIYSALEQYAFSFEMNYSQKTVSVRNGTYGANGEQQNPVQSALDTQA